jgi:hypothetical protein
LFSIARPVTETLSDVPFAAKRYFPHGEKAILPGHARRPQMRIFRGPGERGIKWICYFGRFFEIVGSNAASPLSGMETLFLSA